MAVNQRPVFSNCTQSSTPRKIPPFERRSSPPIPIKSTIHAEDSGSHDSSDDLESYYNQLTWRMYNRITEARRIRAYVRQSNSFDSEDYDNLNSSTTEGKQSKSLGPLSRIILTD